MRTLILASQSPRRKDLLTKAGFEFIVSSLEISEIPNENLSLEKQIEDLAWRKAQALVESGKLLNLKDILVLSADTVVVIEGQIVGKPRDRTESAQTLLKLSGRTHQVITGICLWALDGSIQSSTKVVSHEIAEVTFRALGEGEMKAYVDSGDGMDKAGAYGIQGAGAAFVAHLRGSVDNVMGLPVGLVERLINENSWIINRRKS
jgi:septum formation protein